MRKGLFGIAAALALAVAGTVVIVQYVRGAEARALEGQETVEVLVMTEDVAAGTPAGDLANRTTAEVVPAKLRTEGTIETLDTLGNTVAAVDLVAGEQVLESRFVESEEYATAADVDVPEGLVEVTVSLTPDRAVGGKLSPGDAVSVLSSFDPFDLDGVRTEDDPGINGDEVLTETVLNEPGDVPEDGVVDTGEREKTPTATHLIVNGVLVTNVQLEKQPTAVDTTTASGEVAEPAPTGNLLVTLAVSPENAERLVFTAEFGHVWLAADSGQTDVDDTRIQTRTSVYADPAAEEDSK